MADDPDSKFAISGLTRRIGTAVFWLAGSAVVGSAALVLWNRRALKTMREAAETFPDPVRQRDDDGIY